MGCGINVITALLACATAASAFQAPFPIICNPVYDYHAVVTTSITDDGPVYSSQYALKGILTVTHETGHSELGNAYTVALSNVTTDMHNGETTDYSEGLVRQPIDGAANAIQKPFLIMYYENSTLQGVKFDKNDPEWSKNMKKAMASMLQLDLTNIKLKNVTNLPYDFVSQEKTIHGDCAVTYNVYYPSKQNSSNVLEDFRINKTFSPMKCDGFPVHEFSNVDNELGKNKEDHRMFTDSIRQFKVEKLFDQTLIHELVADGIMSVLSSTGASYPHFVVTKSTFKLLRCEKPSNRQTTNLFDSSTIHDVVYQKPETRYMPNAAIDVTQGRHVVSFANLAVHLETLLIEAIDYIDENNLDPNKVDWGRIQTMNKIVRAMSYMDADTLQVVFNAFDKFVSTKSDRIKTVFLNAVSQVGTPAACHFTHDIILSNQLAPLMAISMLNKLPLNVKIPTIELLSQMEGLLRVAVIGPIDVRKAAILSFSSLVYRTFKHESRPEESAILNKYLQDFFNHVRNDPSYEMRVVYLMAIRNVQVGKIYNLLEPIIDGSLEISEDPQRFQLLAIWAINKAVEENYDIALHHLWPVMVNTTLPLKLRIAAYEILIKQAPDQSSIMKVHKYVSSEANEHFYNYHYTTLDSIANSADQSKVETREIVRSILETMSVPQLTNVHYPVSGVFSIRSIADRFNYAEQIDIGIIVNELTGEPEILKFDHVVVDNDGAVVETAIHVHLEDGLNFISNLGTINSGGFTFNTVQELLEKAAKLLPEPKTFLLDMIFMENDRVYLADRFGYRNIEMISNAVMQHCQRHLRPSTDGSVNNYQNVVFRRWYEIQLTSDIGVPVVVETRVPVVNSLKVNLTITEQDSVDVAFQFKKWIHGDYSMSVYNPMKDVWHAVRSVTVSEFSLPLYTTISSGDRNSLKFSFPERPGTATPAVGLLLLGNHMVTVDEDRTQALMESCSRCHHQVNVHDNRQQQPFNSTAVSFQFRDAGLLASTNVYHCDYPLLSEMFLGYVPEWDRSYTSKRENTWENILIELVMAVRKEFTSSFLLAQMRRCGGILKVEPSTLYPVSDINTNLRLDYVDLDRDEVNFEYPHAQKRHFGFTFDTVSSITKTTDRLWNFEIDVNMNRGHLVNNASVEITRKAAEEQDFKICIDTKKTYPEPPADHLKIGETDEEINSEVIVNYGYTNGEDCVRNETWVSIRLKAQLSDEQKNQLKHDMENSACSDDKYNPLYATSTNLVPRTINCLNEAIRYTTPRLYTVDVSHAGLPENVKDFCRSLFMIYDGLYGDDPDGTSHVKIVTEFSMETNSVEFQLMENNIALISRNISLKKLIPDERGPVMKPLWDFPLDNSRFNLKYLFDYVIDDIRVCSVYPQIVLTDDGEKTPYTIPSDKWVLISGDHVNKQFAIFAKQLRPNYLSVLVFVNDQMVHIYTREANDELVATVDHKEPDDGDMMQYLFTGALPLKVLKRDDHYVVHIRAASTRVLVGSNYVNVIFDSEVQGHVSGLCGHLNGTSPDSNPEIYSMLMDVHNN